LFLKTAEVYESIEELTGNNDESEKRLLKDFCNVSRKNKRAFFFKQVHFILEQGQRKRKRLPFP
jgi:hypothetical protein